jgi:hypothetical protein
MLVPTVVFVLYACTSIVLVDKFEICSTVEVTKLKELCSHRLLFHEANPHDRHRDWKLSCRPELFYE